MPGILGFLCVVLVAELSALALMEHTQRKYLSLINKLFPWGEILSLKERVHLNCSIEKWGWGEMFVITSESSGRNTD